MEGVKGLHAEFADDATVVNSDSTVSGACEKANNDLKVVGKLCKRCNMSVLDKTEVIIYSFDGKYVDESVRIYMGEKLNKIGKRKNGNNKRKICTEKHLNTSLKYLSLSLTNHGRHGLFSFLSSLPISVLHN